MRETHRFDPERAKALDSSSRKERFDPDGLLKDVGVTEGSICVDIGCGTGFFTFPLASIVADKGKVFAVDASSDMLGYLESKSPPATIQLVEADAASTGLAAECADFCTMGFVFHEHESPEKVVAEIYRFLKPGGRVVIIDWQAKEGIPGPPLADRISKEDTQSLLQSGGFVNLRLVVDGEYHYAVSADKR